VTCIFLGTPFYRSPTVVGILECWVSLERRGPGCFAAAAVPFPPLGVRGQTCVWFRSQTMPSIPHIPDLEPPVYQASPTLPYEAGQKPAFFVSGPGAQAPVPATPTFNPALCHDEHNG